VLFTLIAGQLIEKYSMRTFMQEGIRIIMMALILIAFVEVFVDDLHIFTAILTFVQMAGFSLSYGPCCFVLVTCILHDIWLPSVILWISIFLHSILIPNFVDTFGIGILSVIYFICQILGFIYISAYLIETTGKSRSELYAEFRKGIFPNPIRYLRDRLSGQEKGKAYNQTGGDTEMRLIDREQNE
jgi:hypothetical protein